MQSQMMSSPTAQRHDRRHPPPHRHEQPAGAVHLTRRGRAALLVLLVAVLFGAFSLGRAAPQAASVAQPGPAAEQITVQPGESLWTVARRIAPDNDPREVIAQLRRLNDLTSSHLQAGQQLLLPTAA